MWREAVNERTAKAQRFFDTLWPDDVIGKLVVWTLPDKKSKFFNSTQEAAAYAGGCNGSDVYFGVGSADKDLGENRRGDIGNVKAFPALVADLDIAGPGHKGSKKELFEDLKAAEAFLASVPLSPTMTVFSGGGLHAYWRLTEPWEIDSDESRVKIMTLSKGWAGFLSQAAAHKGYQLDHVHDISRVLRVPGGKNHKNAKAVPVEIMSCDNKKEYSDFDFEPYLIVSKTKGGIKEKTISCGDLTLSADAQPPFDKFEALLCNIPEFKKSWERTRKDLKDTSASGYDLALANIAVRAGWSAQETADLMLASRVKHGDNLKIRDGKYYADTIDLAFAPVVTERKIDVSLDAILASVVKPTQWTREAWEEDSDERANAIIALQKALCLPISSVDKYGKSINSVYKVTFENDEVNNFQCVADFESQKIWHDIAAAMFLSDPLHPSKPTWNKIVRIMRQLIVEHDEIEFSQVSTTMSWIDDYVGDDPCTPDELVDMTMPFIHKEELFIRLTPFLQHLKDTLRIGSFTPQTMGSLLSDAGFVSVRKDHPKTKVKTRFWTKCLSSESICE